MLTHKTIPLCLLLSATFGCGDEDTPEDIPFTVSEGNLSGFINGEPWEFVQGHTDPFFSEPSSYHVKLHNATYTGCDSFSGPSGPKIGIAVLPRTPGDYPLGTDQSITFFVPPGDNNIASEGRLEVYEVTDAIVRAGLHAVMNPAFTVNGRFEVDICPD